MLTQMRNKYFCLKRLKVVPQKTACIDFSTLNSALHSLKITKLNMLMSLKQTNFMKISCAVTHKLGFDVSNNFEVCIYRSFIYN
jgi:hypothetical protein